MDAPDVCNRFFCKKKIGGGRFPPDFFIPSIFEKREVIREMVDEETGLRHQLSIVDEAQSFFRPREISRLLFAAHENLRMLIEGIMECGGAAFCSSHDK